MHFFTNSHKYSKAEPSRREKPSFSFSPAASVLFSHQHPSTFTTSLFLWVQNEPRSCCLYPVQCSSFTCVTCKIFPLEVATHFLLTASLPGRDWKQAACVPPSHGSLKYVYVFIISRQSMEGLLFGTLWGNIRAFLFWWMSTGRILRRSLRLESSVWTKCLCVFSLEYSWESGPAWINAWIYGPLCVCVA